MRPTGTILRAIGVGLLVGGAAGAASAEEFPTGTVTLVVGFAPGGESESGARGIAPHWERTLGQPVIVDTRPGAGMQIALEYAWAQPHDGHTVFWHNQQYLSALDLDDPDLPYATDQWVWLDVLENDPAVITVRVDSPWQTLPELVDDMRERPGEITVGLLVGSVQLLGCKTLFEDILDVEFREVPQDSGAPMRTALVGGHLDMICTNDQGTFALGDEVRTLAVFNDAGSRLNPDAEPINAVLEEMGHDARIPDLGSLRGPAVSREFRENHPERFDTLYETYIEAIESPEYQAWLEETGRAAITSPVSMEEAERMISEYDAFFQEHRDVFLGQ